jgi:DegV family protein with EDD domain
MPENVCLAVDACCDLPADFIQRHKIRVLPIYLKFGDKVFVDNRDPRRTAEFYKRGLLEKSIDAESVPVSAQEMSKILEQELVLQFDRVLAITISSTRSGVYKNIRDAVFVSAPKFRDLRSSKGLDRDFSIEVLDSTNLFTGQGVLVYEAARLLQQEGVSFEQAVRQLESLKNHVRAFVLPQDLYHLKNRARTKGDNSVSALSYMVGNMLNIKPIIQGYQGETGPVDKVMGYDSGLKQIFNNTIAAIDKGLSINVVVMSYAGDLSGIEQKSEYQDFVRHARGRGVPTLLSPMSTTSAINVGPGSFSLAYAE